MVIVDEFTGRLMPGRRWSEGLHQAVEAKEGVKIQNEQRTLATITFQNYFRMYDKLSGMTGTAETEARGVPKIYDLEVVVIPTNRPMVRGDYADLVFASQKGKWSAVVEEIVEEHETGRPVLVGTISVESQRDAGRDARSGAAIQHSVLNAKFHEREAEIVAQAGRAGAVTIATNMAGRGTDILLGGNPEMLAAELLHKQGTNVLEATPDAVAAALAEAERVCAEEREQGDRRRRPAHRRHRAARGAPNRQPAARPRRPAGRPRKQPLLPVARGRPHAPLRQRPRASRSCERLGFDDETALESGMVSRDHRGRPDAGRGLQLRHAQARRRVRRRHQPPARDDLPRARADPAQRRPVVDDPGDAGDEVAALVASHTAGEHATEWNREGLQHSSRRWCRPSTRRTSSAIGELNDTERMAGQRPMELANDAYDAKRAESAREGAAILERLVLLRVIDSLWVEHLTAVDDMRRGIGLRAYSQRDPLNEFKVEAYRMFDELKATIRHDVTHTIFRVRSRARRPPQPAMPRNVIEGRPDVPGTGGSPTQPPPAGTSGNGTAPAKAGPKVGRNDPCWCGSGKKYKRCHGA